MDQPTWYGVRTVYEHLDLARGRQRLYEERVVLVRAHSFEEAISTAEREAVAYCKDETKFLGYLNAYEMSDMPRDGAEVFSLMRESRLEPKRYVDEFFDTGRERTQELD